MGPVAKGECRLGVQATFQGFCISNTFKMSLLDNCKVLPLPKSAPSGSQDCLSRDATEDTTACR